MSDQESSAEGKVVPVVAGRSRGARSAEPQPPAVDIYEVEDGWVLKADMPGVGKDGVGIEVEKGVLTIEGRMGEAASSGRVVHHGFERADYFRSFPLSDEIDREKITAKVHEGVLTVTLPKAEEAKTRKIVVEGD